MFKLVIVLPEKTTAGAALECCGAEPTRDSKECVQRPACVVASPQIVSIQAYIRDGIEADDVTAVS